MEGFYITDKKYAHNIIGGGDISGFISKYNRDSCVGISMYE